MPKTHKVKVISENPFAVLIPSEMFVDCDTRTVKEGQKRCKKGHKLEYTTWVSSLDTLKNAFDYLVANRGEVKAEDLERQFNITPCEAQFVIRMNGGIENARI